MFHRGKLIIWQPLTAPPVPTRTRTGVSCSYIRELSLRRVSILAAPNSTSVGRTALLVNYRGNINLSVNLYLLHISIYIDVYMHTYIHACIHAYTRTYMYI